MTVRRSAAVARRWGRWIGTGDRWVVDRVAARHSPVLDRVFPLVGRSADFGRLWLVIAGALAATGNKRARRAGLRGLVALSMASGVTNVVTKQLTRRKRPVTTTIPPIRLLRRMPWTTSFPSGHSASAAAFATAVTVESPWLGVPIGIIAATVAASRVVTGAHYPSDVAAGLAIGTGAGLLTLWWWPRSPSGPAAAYQPEYRAVSSMSGAGVVIVVNVRAGSANDDIVTALRNELPDAEVIAVAPDGDLAALVAQAADRAKVLGVAGGDGTINLAARHAMDRDIPLLVLPAGTLNHFASELGVMSAADAINALRAGSAVRVDVGRVDHDVFLNTFSTGLYADLVRFRERWERRVGKWPAVLIGLVHVLRRSEPHELLVDGVPRRLWLLFAGNGRYRPKGFAPTYRPSLVDGHLDLRVVDADTRWARTRIVLATVTRTLRWTRLYEATAPDRVRLGVPDSMIRLSIDGEVKLVPGDLVVRIDRRALLVYRPERR